MPLPTIEKTWIFDVNNIQTPLGSVAADYQKMWYLLKQSMIGNPTGYLGTVRSSSNSSSANTSDNWSGTSSLVWNNAGSAHSWIVIRLPGIGSTFDVCIDLNSTNSYFATVAVSPGGYNTNGTTTARPTATNSDEYVLLNTTNSAWGNADVGFVLHNWYSSDGKIQRHIVCQGFYPVMFCQFETANNPVTGWNSGANYPWIASYSASGAQATNTITDVRFFQGANIAGRANGTNMAMYLTCEGAGNASLSNSLSLANQISGEWDMLPAGLRSATAGVLGRHGQVYDLWYGLTSVTTGVTYPSQSDRRWAQFGSLILPWDSTQYVSTAV